MKDKIISDCDVCSFLFEDRCIAPIDRMGANCDCEFYTRRKKNVRA